MANLQTEVYQVTGNASSTLSTKLLQYRLQRLSTGHECIDNDKYYDNNKHSKDTFNGTEKTKQTKTASKTDEDEGDEGEEYFNRLVSDFLFLHSHDDDADHNAVRNSTQVMFDSYQHHFLGSGVDERRNLLLKNLIRLRHGLVFDEELQKEIFFEKLSFMIILLSADKRRRPIDRKTWCFFPHHTECFCDYKTTGCRKQRLLTESVSRLEYFNLQYQKLKESMKSRIDPSLNRFYEQNEKFIKRFEERIRERERIRKKRKTRLLDISKFFDKVKEAKREEGVKAYRDTAESAQQEERYRVAEHEKAKDLNKQSLLKRLKFVKFERVLPPIEQVLPPIEDTKASPQALSPRHENYLISGSSSEEEEEFIQLPIIVLKAHAESSSTKTTLSKLRSIRKKNKQQNTKTSAVSSPIKLKPKASAKLPPLNEAIKNKLKMALQRRKNVAERQDVNKTPVTTATTPRRKHNKISKRRRRKNRSTASSTDGRLRVDENIPPAVSSSGRGKKKSAAMVLDVTKKIKEPDFLEVDLGKDYFVQQIVLEQKDRGKVLSRRQRRRSFTVSYSNDGNEWLNYNDAVGNPVPFRDDGDKPFSLHVWDDGLMTRFLRVHPTVNKSRFEINETLLGVRLEQENNEKKKNKRQPRTKRTKRVMDTVVKTTISPPQMPLKSPPKPPPPTLPEKNEKEEENISIEEFGEEDEIEFDDFQDDLIVRTSSLLLTNDNDNETRQRQSTERRVSIFSINSIQEDAENQEELLRRKKAEEEEAAAKREKEKLDRIARRNRLLAEKRHQIRRELERERRNQGSKKPSHKDEGGSHTNVNNYEFFDKYCLYTQEQLAWYQAIFDDIERFEIGCKKDYLPLQAALDGLNIINKSLVTPQDFNYIFTILENFDIEVTGGMNFRTFSLIAAFSERIRSLRKFFNSPSSPSLNIDLNYSELVPCLSKVKQLYKVLLNGSAKTIDVADFLIEMQAAKINTSPVAGRTTNGHDILRYILQNDAMAANSIDFFDYLTFFPLFVFLHDSIVEDMSLI